ncbi:hypothetical protein [Nocardia camponoti]|uniref:Uncharacterized protein n=1 Tax=Nocardia camponoti TaxID=1616106 RepID=A0A917QPU6_9NOCA|nr:hypothetical protein [Nocardia camponoti]GGK62604.1 hypothetical protein GCM10011591_38520 [Nocardia camponoti]
MANFLVPAATTLWGRAMLSRRRGAKVGLSILEATTLFLCGRAMLSGRRGAKAGLPVPAATPQRRWGRAMPNLR